MKTIAFLCLLASISMAQTPELRTDSTGAVYFQQLVQLDSALDNHAVLRHVLSWLSTAYRQSDPVVERYDPAQGVMVVKAQFLLNSAPLAGRRSTYTSQLVPHLLIVDTHPGQCRLSLTGFEPETARQLRSTTAAVASSGYVGELRQRCLSLLASFRRQWSME